VLVGGGVNGEVGGAERFLTAQADAFIPQKARDGEECAGAKAEEKVGLLRSK